MSMKKIMKILMAILLIICSAMIPSVVKAAELVPSLYFGITELREETGMGYSIWDPDSNGETGIAAKIWNIVQYSGPNTNDPTEANVYCVKAGVGFTEGQGTKEIQEYNLQFDMYTERDAIAKQDADTSKVLYNLVNGGHYNELLAIANLIYIPGESTEAEKETLLRESGVLALQEQEYAGLGDEYKITDDEIEAVQQAAIWYFTNYGEENGKYDVYNQDAWLWYTENGTDYKALSSYGTNQIPAVGTVRREQALALYRYLVDEAKEQAANYENSDAKHRNKLTLYTTAGGNSQPLMKVEKIPQEFDLALRKYITEVNGVAVANSRVPVIDESTLENGTTATYNHRKDPVMVEVGNTVTYNITIYNEGDLDGRATKIVDQLPTGLKYSQIVTAGFTAEYDEETNRVTITREESNTENLTAYEQGQLDSETIEIECVVDASENGKILTNVAWIAEEVDEYGNVIVDEVGKDRDSEPGTTPNVNKDNMEDYKGNTENKDDLTDETYFYKGEQDDDDFEKLIVNVPEEKAFDLKLIKRITELNGEKVPERLLGVDITNLANGTQTTADYEMNKEPVAVSSGDLVTYTFRIYNEGQIDGYAEEITEDIPEGLEFLGAEVDSEMNPITDEDELEAVKFNTSMGWAYVEGDTTKISTDYLGKGKGEEITTPGANVIKAFDPSSPYSDTETQKNPDYKEISVIFKVVTNDPSIGIIRNEAAITEDADSEGNPVDDRDSNTENWVKYEDDEDYDNIILQEFDLALRKFITKVDKEEVTTRIPEVSYDREEDKITYNHTKEPVEVITGNVVEYTIRVYNEGDMAGYAQEVSDDIPDGLKFLPENETNIEYRWVMYDEEGNVTDNVEEAVEIRTDYLSKEQGESRANGEEETTEGTEQDAQEGATPGATDENTEQTTPGTTTDGSEEQTTPETTEENGEGTENPNLLQAFNPEEEIGEGNPDYRDIKVAFEVVEPNESDRIIVNSAQITEDSDENGNPVEDKDSIPDEWNEGEDDQDREYIKLTYFDLALRKWVTEAIVIENGQETITQTGHTAEMDPEPVVKVELYRKDLNSVTVKFRYSIRITNEGDIAGYATEITDYVPEGLRFVAEDNPEWTDEGNNVISTKQLANTLLQPGESAEVEVVLTWINGEDNMGQMTNIAEISEHYNDKGAPDRDSTPDNQVWGEDDIDDAPVLLSIETGQERIYYVLGFTVLGTLAGGLALIKKFVI